MRYEKIFPIKPKTNDPYKKGMVTDMKDNTNEAKIDGVENDKLMVKVSNLVKRYGQNYALNDVSFEIEEGEIVGLLGPNGAGKSTTMNILTGYLSATSGVAKIGGVSILENPIEAKRLIGFLPEQPPVYGDMTVLEYLEFVYELKGAKQEREAHISEIINTVRLADVKNRLIRNLSKGYKQRVGIAQALIGDPKLIVFDEPTSSLNTEEAERLFKIIDTLKRRGCGIIYISHKMEEILRICDEVTIMRDGKHIATHAASELTMEKIIKLTYI